MALARGGKYNLTKKQEDFVLKFCETGSATAAYRHAYTVKNMTDKTIRESASKLLDDRNVSLAIEEIRNKNRQRHHYTVDDFMAEMEEARQIALEDRKPNVMVSASLGKAKVMGLLVDKQEITHNGAPSVVVELVGVDPNDI